MVFCSHSGDILALFPKGFAGGAVAVYLFFVISGYIVAYAIERFYHDNYTGFLINRALRIYPVHIVTYAISVISLYWLGQPVLDNISIAGLSVLSGLKALTIVGAYMDLHAMRPNGVAWSIIVEMAFYLAVGLAPLLLGRAMGRHRALLLLLSVSLLLFAAVIAVPNGSVRVHGIFKFTPFFALGLLTYYASVARSIGLWLAAAGMCMLALAWLLGSEGYYFYGYGGDLFWRAANVVVFCLLYCILLGMIRLKLPPLMRQIDKSLGNLTYPVYMVHTPLLSWFSYYAPWGGHGLPAWSLALLLTLTVAAILHLFVELPLFKLRDRLRGTSLR